MLHRPLQRPLQHSATVFTWVPLPPAMTSWPGSVAVVVAVAANLVAVVDEESSAKGTLS
jgi:hypothetical protein